MQAPPPPVKGVELHDGRTLEVTDFTRIRRIGLGSQDLPKEQSLFPGRVYYAFASVLGINRADPDGSWMVKFRAQAKEQGMEVVTLDGEVYLVWDEPKPLSLKDMALGGLNELLRAVDTLSKEEHDRLMFAMSSRCSSHSVEEILRKALNELPED
jgi:hypothetical protein